jgi:hypothetical protein
MQVPTKEARVRFRILYKGLNFHSGLVPLNALRKKGTSTCVEVRIKYVYV